MTKVKTSIPVDLVREMRAAKRHLREALPHLDQLSSLTCDSEDQWTGDTVNKLIEHIDRRISLYSDSDDRYFPVMSLKSANRVIHSV